MGYDQERNFHALHLVCYVLLYECTCHIFIQDCGLVCKHEISGGRAMVTAGRGTKLAASQSR